VPVLDDPEGSVTAALNNPMKPLLFPNWPRAAEPRAW
jgi:hypothetical protein